MFFCHQTYYLFSLYAENIMHQIVSTKSIKINGSLISNIRCTDDAVLMIDSTQSLQLLLSSLQSESEKRGLTINAKKTNIMVLSKNTENRCSSTFLDGANLDQINHFDYPSRQPCHNRVQM